MIGKRKNKSKNNQKIKKRKKEEISLQSLQRLQTPSFTAELMPGLDWTFRSDSAAVRGTLLGQS